MEVTFVEEQPLEGAERRVGPGTTVGRAGADLELVDPDVSRRHATFHQVDAGIGIEDLGSRNGTFVNDEKISGIAALSRGDRVRFGNTVWRFDASRQTTEPRSVEAAD
jgi:pSer/pThr/pTyr-binding forkhead associated (FHA) protein